MVIIHLDLLFYKLPIEDFYLIFYWVVVYLFLLTCRSLPNILHSGMSLVLRDNNNFFLSLAWLFILLKVCLLFPPVYGCCGSGLLLWSFFEEHKFFIWCGPIFQPFPLLLLFHLLKRIILYSLESCFPPWNQLCVWYKVGVQPHFYSYQHLAVSAPFFVQTDMNLQCLFRSISVSLTTY